MALGMSHLLLLQKHVATDWFFDKSPWFLGVIISGAYLSQSYRSKYLNIESYCFLPPYSRKLNLIDNLRKHVKYHWRDFTSWTAATWVHNVQTLLADLPGMAIKRGWNLNRFSRKNRNLSKKVNINQHKNVTGWLICPKITYYWCSSWQKIINNRLYWKPILGFC